MTPEQRIEIAAVGLRKIQEQYERMVCHPPYCECPGCVATVTLKLMFKDEADT